MPTLIDRVVRGTSDLLHRTGTFEFVNQFVDWYRLPLPVAVLNLVALRDRLRAKNLHGVPEAELPRPLEGAYPRCVHARTADGSYNDLAQPQMGATGARFGRNVALEYAYPDRAKLMTPNPRLISNRLMARTAFKPATTLNLLAAAWIQFQTHDWFTHGENEVEDPHEVPIPPGDDWEGMSTMRIRRTRHDTRPTSGAPPTFRNQVTHWWDASQIYGSDLATQSKVRSGVDGKLNLTPEGWLPVGEDGLEITGFNGAWWIGLSLMHTLFVREHNSICDMLRVAYPDWSDQQLFDVARAVNAALIAKIHTIEWTPAILGNPVLEVAMNGNWYGLASKEVKRIWGRIGDDEAVSGIIGSTQNHTGEPFALTEEFVSVYRMHPLMPDELELRGATDGSLLAHRMMADLIFAGARKTIDETGMSLGDLAYSFGVAHPGAICLQNFPSFLRNLVQTNGEHFDLAAVDILRDRERGVPRYNDFREQLGRGRVHSFQQITSNPDWARELEQLYGDVDLVDALVGMLAEDLPPGFGFSDTAFRVFILMASRRLLSDRFFTTDYGPHVYTPEGLQWIEYNTMQTLLLRHFPELGAALRNVENAFAPWHTVSATIVEPSEADDATSARSVEHGVVDTFRD